MNPLTLVKRIQNINAKEAALGISDEASWHAKYKESAYVYIGGIPFDLTEGDLLAVFAQYGEIVDVNLVRDKGTGKSKGFAFVAYEDQRSTILAVDNLNGAAILGRTIRVDHVSNYKKKEEEDEETQQRKREERGVCRAFQKGECNRGAGCKFSHDERRAANTGWGHEEDRHSRRANGRIEAPARNDRHSGADGRFEASARNERHSVAEGRFEASARNERHTGVSSRVPESAYLEGHASSSKDSRSSRAKGSNIMDSDRHNEHGELASRDEGLKDRERKLAQKEKETRHGNNRDGSHDRGTRSYDAGTNSREDRDLRDGRRSRKRESESNFKEDRDGRGKDRRSIHDSSSGRRTLDDEHRPRSHRY